MKIHLTKPNGLAKDISEIVNDAISCGFIDKSLLAPSDRDKFDMIVSMIRSQLGEEYTLKGNNKIFFNKKTK